MSWSRRFCFYSWVCLRERRFWERYWNVMSSCYLSCSVLKAKKHNKTKMRAYIYTRLSLSLPLHLHYGIWISYRPVFCLRLWALNSFMPTICASITDRWRFFWALTCLAGAGFYIHFLNAPPELSCPYCPRFRELIKNLPTLKSRNRKRSR